MVHDALPREDGYPLAAAHTIVERFGLARSGPGVCRSLTNRGAWGRRDCFVAALLAMTSRADGGGDFHRGGAGLGWMVPESERGRATMLDLSPDIAPPQPVRLADYRPPEFLVDTVDLVFDLDGANTRVKARLGVRRNPAGADPKSALQLDGEELELVVGGARRRGARREPLPAAARRRAGHRRRAGCLHPRRRNPHRARQEHRAFRALYVGWQFLHPMRARGLSPDHLFRRPAGCDGALFDDDRRRQGAVSGAAVERQPGRVGRGRQTGGTGRNGSIRTPSPPICSRWSPAIWSRSATGSRLARAGRWRSGSGCAAATRTNAATRWPR